MSRRSHGRILSEEISTTCGQHTLDEEMQAYLGRDEPLNWRTSVLITLSDVVFNNPIITWKILVQRIV